MHCVAFKEHLQFFQWWAQTAILLPPFVKINQGFKKALLKKLISVRNSSRWPTLPSLSPSPKMMIKQIHLPACAWSDLPRSLFSIGKGTNEVSLEILTSSHLHVLVWPSVYKAWLSQQTISEEWDGWLYWSPGFLALEASLWAQD